MNKKSLLNTFQSPHYYFSLFTLICICFSSSLFAGSLDSPAAITDDNSAMFTVDDIYKRLNSGAVGNKRTTSFSEPGSGPVATGYNLNDVMGKAPTLDDTNGATAAEVANGKTYWGLKNIGEWGLKTGTRNPALVPKTGQNVCYINTEDLSLSLDEISAIRPSRLIINCAGSGQDGDLQKGVAHASPRFTDNTDGTVTDNSTGLIWLKNTHCANASRSWVTALSDVVQLNTNGTINSNNCGNTGNQTDWRLPNVKELQSLVDFQNENPALPTGHPFSFVQSNWCWWSSTTDVSHAGYAWEVDLYVGRVVNRVKTFSCYVWPVRGGQ